MNLSKLEKIFAKHLSLEVEPDFLRIVLATVIANKLDTTPVWLMIIAAAGTGKSEILSSLGMHPSVHTISILTPATLVSFSDRFKKEGGKKTKVDDSLMSKLNNKTLILKDASTITTINPHTKSTIFGQLRDAFDGSLTRSTGMGEKTIKAKFGLIMGATSAVEHSYTLDRILGERFLNYRPILDWSDGNVCEKIKSHSSNYAEMKQELAETVYEFFETAGEPEATFYHPEIEKISLMLSTLRTDIIRDRFTKQICFPSDQTEMPTRIYKQLSALFTSLLHITHSEKLSMHIVRRVAKDSIPYIRLRILKAIAKGKNTFQGINEDTNLSYMYLRQNLQELEIFNIIEKIPIKKTVRPNPLAGEEEDQNSDNEDEDNKYEGIENNQSKETRGRKKYLINIKPPFTNLIYCRSRTDY